MHLKKIACFVPMNSRKHFRSYIENLFIHSLGSSTVTHWDVGLAVSFTSFSFSLLVAFSSLLDWVV